MKRYRSAAPVTSFESLYPDVLSLVMHYLSLEEIARCNRTCYAFLIAFRNMRCYEGEVVITANLKVGLLVFILRNNLSLTRILFDFDDCDDDVSPLTDWHLFAMKPVCTSLVSFRATQNCLLCVSIIGMRFFFDRLFTIKHFEGSIAPNTLDALLMVPLETLNVRYDGIKNQPSSFNRFRELKHLGHFTDELDFREFLNIGIPPKLEILEAFVGHDFGIDFVDDPIDKLSGFLLNAPPSLNHLILGFWSAHKQLARSIHASLDKFQGWTIKERNYCIRNTFDVVHIFRNVQICVADDVFLHSLNYEVISKSSA